MHSPLSLASLVAQMVKCLLTIRETWVRSLGGEDPWRRKWQPTPVLLPGKSHGRRILIGDGSWGGEHSDATERLTLHFFIHVYISSIYTLFGLP